MCWNVNKYLDYKVYLSMLYPRISLQQQLTRSHKHYPLRYSPLQWTAAISRYPGLDPTITLNPN